jgi:hypothetical protein
LLALLSFIAFIACWVAGYGWTTVSGYVNAKMRSR